MRRHYSRSGFHRPSKFNTGNGSPRLHPLSQRFLQKSRVVRSVNGPLDTYAAYLPFGMRSRILISPRGKKADLRGSIRLRWKLEETRRLPEANEPHHRFDRASQDDCFSTMPSLPEFIQNHSDCRRIEAARNLECNRGVPCLSQHSILTAVCDSDGRRFNVSQQGAQ
jgi:hypothetical protein